MNHDSLDSPLNFGGTNGTGQVSHMAQWALAITQSGNFFQVPLMGNFGLIDRDTPKDAYSKPSYRDGSEWRLVFSDEFNADGRSFYPGDDPYWEAADLHYWVSGRILYFDYFTHQLNLHTEGHK